MEDPKPNQKSETVEKELTPEEKQKKLVSMLILETDQEIKIKLLEKEIDSMPDSFKGSSNDLNTAYQQKMAELNTLKEKLSVSQKETRFFSGEEVKKMEDVEFERAEKAQEKINAIEWENEENRYDSSIAEKPQAHIESQKLDLQIAQDDFKKAEELERLTDKGLADQADQMDKNKEISESKSDSKSKAIEPDEITSYGNGEIIRAIDRNLENVGERAGVPAIIEKPEDPSREQMLEKLLEESRKSYVDLDYKMDKDSSSVRKFFGLSRKKLGNFNDAFETAKLNYENRLRAYVKEKIKGGIISAEKAESLTNFIIKDEYVKLAELRDETRIENSPLSEKIKRGAQKIIDRYRKMPLWAKMSIGSGLAVSGIGVGASVGWRVFCGAVSVTGYKQMFEGIAQKLQGKKDEKEIMSTIKNSKIEGMGPVQRELLLKNLETAIQDIDQKMQKKKQAKRWRTFTAVGAGIGTAIVGRQVGEWVGEKFHNAFEYIGEKNQGNSYFQQQIEDNLEPAKPSGAAAYMEGMEDFKPEDVTDIEAIPSDSGAQMEPIENVEKFDELANKPFEELKGEGSLNMEPDKIPTEVKIDESKLADTIPDAKAPDEAITKTSFENETQKFDNLANKPLEEMQEEIPKIDQKTSESIFYPEGKIESVSNVDSSKPQYDFDPMDKVEVGQGNINNIVSESSSTEVPEVVKTEVVPAKESIIVENSAQDEVQAGSVFQNEDAIPEQGRPGAESYPQGLEHVEKMREGIDKLLSASNDPDQIMIFLRREFSLDNIDNWRGIRMSSVDSLISDRSTGGIGEKVGSLINKLELDYSLGKDIKPLYGETIESWTRRAGEMLMKSKNN
jgi:hypothetical protein